MGKGRHDPNLEMPDWWLNPTKDVVRRLRGYYTQSELAFILEVHPSSVSAWETGASQIDAFNLRKLWAHYCAWRQDWNRLDAWYRKRPGEEPPFHVVNDQRAIKRFLQGSAKEPPAELVRLKNIVHGATDQPQLPDMPPPDPEPTAGALHVAAPRSHSRTRATKEA